MPSNFLLINKPLNWTSHDVVAVIRRQVKQNPTKYRLNSNTKIKNIKVGHAGTLDPFATGLLIVGVGREATRELDKFKNLPKTYEAILKLGEVSDTGDNTGKISKYHFNVSDPSVPQDDRVEILKQVQDDRNCNAILTEKESLNPLIPQDENNVNVILSKAKNLDPSIPQDDNMGQNDKNKNVIPARVEGSLNSTIIPLGMTKPHKKEIKKVLKTFLGIQNQTPPMYSAKKINGEKLYDLARQGIEIERKPCQIEIYKIKLLKYNWPFLKIRVQCSTGTYIRTLSEDIGQKLGVGAYCQKLKRTKIGQYKLWRAKKPIF